MVERRVPGPHPLPRPVAAPVHCCRLHRGRPPRSAPHRIPAAVPRIGGRRRDNWSWTESRYVARTYAAGGFGGRLRGAVWTALVDPDRLLARNRHREESEYVVDTIASRSSYSRTAQRSPTHRAEDSCFSPRLISGRSTDPLRLFEKVERDAGAIRLPQWGAGWRAPRTAAHDFGPLGGRVPAQRPRRSPERGSAPDRRQLHGVTFTLDPGSAFRPAGCSAAPSPGPLPSPQRTALVGKLPSSVLTFPNRDGLLLVASMEPVPRPPPGTLQHFGLVDANLPPHPNAERAVRLPRHRDARSARHDGSRLTRWAR